jgi:poly(3-hydroxybutyrate) depolymerase
MLYHIYDFQQAMLSPMRLAAEAMQQFYSHPFVPAAYTRAGRAVAASSELVERATRRYRKPAFGIDSIECAGRSVPVVEQTVVAKPFCRLVRFARQAPQNDPKVLLVAPLSGHYATLLRDTVVTLLPAHDVYITDWHNASEVPGSAGSFDLDDYVDYLIEFFDHIGDDCHVVAVCQPSVPVLAAVAIQSAQGAPTPRSMTLMGGPIDTRINPTKVNRVASQRPLDWFEHHVVTRVPMHYPGAMRHVYPGFLQLGGFMTMNLDRHVGSALRHFQHLVRGDGESADAHRRFYDEYLSVMDLTAEFYLQTIRTVFQDHALPMGTMRSRLRPVETRAITRTALLTIEGELDDISGPGQTFAAHRLCSGLRPDQQKGVGHFGIFNGKRWRTDIAPRLGAFIRENR